MKKQTKFVYIIFTGLIISLISCNSGRNSLANKRVIKDYYTSLNKADFKLASKYIADSINSTEMGYILASNREELYRNFQWDSVFIPNYKLTEIVCDSASAVATVSKFCKRIEFLHDSALVFKVRFDFKNNQISKMQLTDYISSDFNKWQFRRDTLVAWIDRYHPELSGFINDLTIKGAQNYFKAIELFNNEK